jgi:hypothetical protein
MIQETAEAISKPAMYGGGFMAGSSWAACKVPFLQELTAKFVSIDASEWFGAIGVSIAFAGFVMNTWFNWRRDKRERAKVEAA